MSGVGGQEEDLEGVGDAGPGCAEVVVGGGLEAQAPVVGGVAEDDDEGESGGSGRVEGRADDGSAVSLALAFGEHGDGGEAEGRGLVDLDPADEGVGDDESVVVGDPGQSVDPRFAGAEGVDEVGFVGVAEGRDVYPVDGAAVARRLGANDHLSTLASP